MEGMSDAGTVEVGQVEDIVLWICRGMHYNNMYSLTPS